MALRRKHIHEIVMQINAILSKVHWKKKKCEFPLSKGARVASKPAQRLLRKVRESSRPISSFFHSHNKHRVRAVQEQLKSISQAQKQTISIKLFYELTVRGKRRIVLVAVGN